MSETSLPDGLVVHLNLVTAYFVQSSGDRLLNVCTCNQQPFRLIHRLFPIIGTSLVCIAQLLIDWRPYRWGRTTNTYFLMSGFYKEPIISNTPGFIFERREIARNIEDGCSFDPSPKLHDTAPRLSEGLHPIPLLSGRCGADFVSNFSCRRFWLNKQPPLGLKVNLK